MKKFEDLLKLEAKSIQKELLNAQKEVMKYKFESRTGQLAGAHLLRRAKKYVSQIKTANSMLNSSKK